MSALESPIRSSCRCLRLGALLSVFGMAAYGQYILSPFTAEATSFYTTPGSIDNNGDIAGVFVQPGQTYQWLGFIRAASGTITTFNLPFTCYTGLFCQAGITGLNDSGQMAGYVADYNSGTVIDFGRDQNGNVTVLSGPPGGAYWYPVGLTNGGELIAQTFAGPNFGPIQPLGQAFLRASNGSFTPLPQPPGGFAPAVFTAINNSGQVAGTAAFCQNNNGFAVSVPACATSYGFVLDIASSQFTFFPGKTAAAGLNDSGTVIGTLYDGAETFTLIGSSGGKLEDTFTPVLQGVPVGINNSGIIAGVASSVTDYTEGYIGTPSTDTALPVISLLSIQAGPPEQVNFSVADSVAGVIGVQTVQQNAQVTILPFNPGQTTPVTVTAVKVDQTQSASIEITAVNGIGLSATLDPAFLTVSGKGGSGAELSNVPAAENVLTISNGNPGLARLDVQVNGHPVRIELTNGEARTISLRAWMKHAVNTLSFNGEGSAEAQASVVLRDAAPGRHL